MWSMDSSKSCCIALSAWTILFFIVSLDSNWCNIFSNLCLFLLWYFFGEGHCKEHASALLLASLAAWISYYSSSPYCASSYWRLNAIFLEDAVFYNESGYLARSLSMELSFECSLLKDIHWILSDRGISFSNYSLQLSGRYPCLLGVCYYDDMSQAFELSDLWRLLLLWACLKRLWAKVR